MLCLGGFELFSRWVSLTVRRYSVFGSSIHSRTCLPVHLWFSSLLRPRCLAPLVRLLRHSSPISKDWNNSLRLIVLAIILLMLQQLLFKRATRKIAVMISVIGNNTYGTLRDLRSPENPRDETFEVLRDLLQRHL